MTPSGMMKHDERKRFILNLGPYKTRAYAWHVCIFIFWNFFERLYKDLSCLEKITDLTLISNWVAKMEPCNLRERRVLCVLNKQIR